MKRDYFLLLLVATGYWLLTAEHSPRALVQSRYSLLYPWPTPHSGLFPGAFPLLRASFPGSAWERTVPEAPPREAEPRRQWVPRQSRAEPGNQRGKNGNAPLVSTRLTLP